MERENFESDSAPIRSDSESTTAACDNDAGPIGLGIRIDPSIVDSFASRSSTIPGIRCCGLLPLFEDPSDPPPPLLPSWWWLLTPIDELTSIESSLLCVGESMEWSAMANNRQACEEKIK